MFNKNSKTHKFLTTNLQKMLCENKWMFFVFFLWAITYVVIDKGLITTKSTITVTGNSMNATRNEIATFNVNIESTNDAKAKAVEETNTRATAVVDAIKSFGIESDDIQTAHMNVFQREENVNGKFVKTDWYASVGITVKLRDVEKATEFSDLLASLDMNNFYGPNFSVDRNNLDETSLLDAALMDAEDKALVTAQSMNRKLGKVIHFTEGGASYGNIYPMYDRASSIGFGGGAPMEPGTTDISKTVTVTYELR